MVALRYALVFSLLIVLVPIVPLELSGQIPYVAEQAEAGEAIYQRSCTVCHLPNLQGSFEGTVKLTKLGGLTRKMMGSGPVVNRVYWGSVSPILLNLTVKERSSFLSSPAQRPYQRLDAQKSAVGTSASKVTSVFASATNSVAPTRSGAPGLQS